MSTFAADASVSEGHFCLKTDFQDSTAIVPCTMANVFGLLLIIERL